MWSRVKLFRLALALAALASVIFAPWWLVLLLSLALSLRFRAWEVVGIGLLMDLLYMPIGVSFSFAGLPWGTLIALVLLFGLEPFRRRLLTGSSAL